MDASKVISMQGNQSARMWLDCWVSSYPRIADLIYRREATWKEICEVDEY